MSLTYDINKMSPKMEPSGTPILVFSGLDFSPSILTFCSTSETARNPIEIILSMMVAEFLEALSGSGRKVNEIANYSAIRVVISIITVIYQQGDWSS